MIHLFRSERSKPMFGYKPFLLFGEEYIINHFLGVTDVKVMLYQSSFTLSNNHCEAFVMYLTCHCV